ncbi:MAG: diphosphomevalonate decarboxylase [Deltaproteobacteria bacterium RIFOXYA12_FULL_61_11]|nr:MAG: diphosphomevalonate decarboxylase [Deltaproteobacteria bacterium RIFOXYA12_FULL_61_11]
MKATANAPANIAFIKYWGRRDHQLFLPLTTTSSMNLDACRSTTTVDFDPAYDRDTITIVDEQGDRKEVSPEGSRKDRGLFRQLDRVRELAGTSLRAKVLSSTNIPLDAGIASSAAGLCAFTAAALAAIGLRAMVEDREALSREVRLTGSVSAARSTHDGFTKHLFGERHEDAVTRQIAPPEHWDLRDLVAVVTREQKSISSSLGHELAHTSPYLEARLAEMQSRIGLVERAILERDLCTLGPAIEFECISMHAVMMTSTPPAYYWSPGTIAVLKQVLGLRKAGLEAYFTLDAGPNVHVLCEAPQAAELECQLRSNPFVTAVLHNRTGVGVRLLDTQFF